MKKIYTLCAILIINLTYGQEPKENLIGLGINSGITIANQTWTFKSPDFKLKEDNITGLYEGVSFEIRKRNVLSEVMELSHYQKGFTEKVPITTVDMPEGNGTYKTFKTRFNYLTPRVIIKARYEINHFIPYAIAGLGYDIMLSYHSDFNYQHIEQDFRKYVWGANFGIGVEYKIKDFGIVGEGQYYYDFSDVMNVSPSVNTAGLEINNNAYSISLGIRYYIHVKIKKGLT